MCPLSIRKKRFVDHSVCESLAEQRVHKSFISLSASGLAIRRCGLCGLKRETDEMRKVILLAEAGVLFAGALFYMAVTTVSRAIWLRVRSA